MKVNKRLATNILNSLNSGVVPSKGVEMLMVGRHLEMTQIKKDLEDVSNDISKIKFFVGPYGSGKSFIQGLLKETALNNNFVVIQADLSPTTRLFANDGKAKQLYTSLLNNLSTTNIRNGGGLKYLLDEWIAHLLEENDETIDIEEIIKHELKQLTVVGLNHVRGFEEAIKKYAKAYLNDDEDMQDKILLWLKGEFNTKTESVKEVGIQSVINDNNYYDYLKIWTFFVRMIGYNGLVVNIDEMVNLYKISHLQSRVNNYERLLTIINDVLQGSLPGLYITFCGTLELVTDERKGFYSYDALKRRLQINRYETKDNRDVAQPVIQLYPLKGSELLVLLNNINDLYKIAHDFDSQINEDNIKFFIQKQFSYPGAEKRLTVGHLVREFINVLNILSNTENNTSDLREELLGKEIKISEDLDSLDEFKDVEDFDDAIEETTETTETPSSVQMSKPSMLNRFK